MVYWVSLKSTYFWKLCKLEQTDKLTEAQDENEALNSNAENDENADNDGIDKMIKIWKC